MTNLPLRSQSQQEAGLATDTGWAPWTDGIPLCLGCWRSTPPPALHGSRRRTRFALLSVGHCCPNWAMHNAGKTRPCSNPAVQPALLPQARQARGCMRLQACGCTRSCALRRRLQNFHQNPTPWNPLPCNQPWKAGSGSMSRAARKRAGPTGGRRTASAASASLRRPSNARAR